MQAEETAQWANCLLHMHKQLSLDTKRPCGSRLWWHTPITPALVGAVLKRASGGFLVSQYMQSTRLMRDSISKTKVGSNRQRKIHEGTQRMDTHQCI